MKQKILPALLLFGSLVVTATAAPALPRAIVLIMADAKRFGMPLPEGLKPKKPKERT